MPEITEGPVATVVKILKNVPLRVVFLVHLFAIVYGNYGMILSSSYLLYNSVFLLTLLWTIHCKGKEEPIIICIILNVLSIFFDISLLIIDFPIQRFSSGMAILNLLLRPISSIVLYNHWMEIVNEAPTDFRTADPNSSDAKNYQDVEGQSYPGIITLDFPYQ